MSVVKGLGRLGGQDGMVWVCGRGSVSWCEGMVR